MLWQNKISVAARQDLLCQDIRESTKGRGPLWRRREAPPPLCLGTREILSCHNRDLVLPQHTSCLATTEILFCHSRDSKATFLGLDVASSGFLRSSFCHCTVFCHNIVFLFQSYFAWSWRCLRRFFEIKFLSLQCFSW